MSKYYLPEEQQKEIELFLENPAVNMQEKSNIRIDNRFQLEPEFEAEIAA